MLKKYKFQEQLTSNFIQKKKTKVINMKNDKCKMKSLKKSTTQGGRREL